MTDRRKIGQELVRRVTRVSEVLEENARLREEIARRRLTDQERAAVAWAARRLSDDPMLPRDRSTADTLRGLLERLD